MSATRLHRWEADNFFFVTQILYPKTPTKSSFFYYAGNIDWAKKYIWRKEPYWGTEVCCKAAQTGPCRRGVHFKKRKIAKNACHVYFWKKQTAQNVTYVHFWKNEIRKNIFCVYFSWQVQGKMRGVTLDKKKCNVCLKSDPKKCKNRSWIARKKCGIL